MGKRIKITLRDQVPQRIIELDPAATEGATFGKDIYAPNGQLVDLRDLLNPNATPGSDFVYWVQLQEIPALIQALATEAGAGLLTLLGSGTLTTREIVSSDGSVTITFPDGVGGNINLSVPTGGGILPMVTGEVYAGQPRFMYFDDGSLFSVQVE